MRKFLIITLSLIMSLCIATTFSFGASGVVIKNYNKVPTLTVGQSYTIYGTIKSKNTIKRVEVGVVNAKTNKWETRYNKKVGKKTFSISKADPYVKFGSLGVGEHKYRIYVHTSKKVYTVLNQQFSVVAKPSPTPPTPPTPTPTHMKTVKEQQAFLNTVNVGTIQGKIAEDGVKGSQTTKAIKIFQQVEGLEVDGVWGKNTNAASSKTIVMSGKRKAINWACSVANDNSFAYGTGKRAHRSGCYFCQTNTGNRKYNKQHKGEPKYVKGHTYTKTYCCNPFITAAYAHGAQDPTVYKKCYAGSSYGMTPSDWKKCPNFKTVGACKNIPYSKLQAGDVILSNKNVNKWTHHVWMYIGHGRYVEASGGTWNASSIAVKGGAKSKYAKYHSHKGTYVMRYGK